MSHDQSLTGLNDCGNDSGRDRILNHSETDPLSYPLGAGTTLIGGKLVAA